MAVNGFEFDRLGSLLALIEALLLFEVPLVREAARRAQSLLWTFQSAA